MPRTTVFCDFDGTITIEDLIVQVWSRFAQPGWEQVVDDMHAGRVSLKEGVPALFAQIPFSKKNEIIAYAKQVVRFREGFPDFLRFCRKYTLNFVVLSGGVDFFVYPVLDPYKQFISRIYSVPSSLNGPNITLDLPYACDTDALCKAKILDAWPKSSQRLFIGDSITDVHGARVANRVFARGRLPALLDREHVAYEPFENFTDIMRELEPQLAAGAAPRRRFP